MGQGDSQALQAPQGQGVRRDPLALLENEVEMEKMVEMGQTVAKAVKDPEVPALSYST